MKFKPALLHFRFDDFASLRSQPNNSTDSVEQTDCNGHKWQLTLYPGGLGTNEEPGWTSLFLHINNTDIKLDVRFTIAVKDANGQTVKESKCEQTFEYDDSWQNLCFMKRSDILDATTDILKNGALRIDVGIQVKDDGDYDLVQPKDDHCSKMLALLESEERADTSFTVGGKVFRVHSPIIFAHSPLLGKRCGDVIQDIAPEVFQILLQHIYTGSQPSEEQILKYGKGLIDASNRYELIRLKMQVEGVLVKERMMTIENVSDYILFADAQCCPLLKEYAVSFFSVHHREVLKSEHSDKLKESGKLLSEIILLMNIGNEDANADSMSVNEMRKELKKRELDIDGSKEALIARLEEAKRQKTEPNSDSE